MVRREVQFCFCLCLKMVAIRECFHVDGNKLLRKKKLMMEERNDMVQPKSL